MVVSNEISISTQTINCFVQKCFRPRLSLASEGLRLDSTNNTHRDTPNFHWVNTKTGNFTCNTNFWFSWDTGRCAHTESAFLNVSGPLIGREPFYFPWFPGQPLSLICFLPGPCRVFCFCFLTVGPLLVSVKGKQGRSPFKAAQRRGRCAQ